MNIFWIEFIFIACDEFQHFSNEFSSFFSFSYLIFNLDKDDDADSEQDERQYDAN